MKKKSASTSKVALIIMFAVCLEIIGYTEVVMYRLADLSSLYVLIGISATLASALIAYYLKSSKENTEGGITFETAMHNLKQPKPNNETADEEDDLQYVSLNDDAVG